MQQLTSQQLPGHYARLSLQGINSTAVDFAAEHLPNAILHQSHIVTAKQCDVTNWVETFYQRTNKWVGYECCSSSEQFVSDVRRRKTLTDKFCAVIQQTPATRWTKKNSMLHSVGIVVDTKNPKILVLDPLKKGQLTVETMAIIQEISQTLNLQVTMFHGFQTRRQVNCLRQVIQMFRYIAFGHIVTGNPVIMTQRQQEPPPPPAAPQRKKRKAAFPDQGLIIATKRVPKIRILKN